MTGSLAIGLHWLYRWCALENRKQLSDISKDDKCIEHHVSNVIQHICITCDITSRVDFITDDASSVLTRKLKLPRKQKNDFKHIN